MKKLKLFIFLCLNIISLPIMAQVSTGQEQEFDSGIKNNLTQTVNSPNFYVTQGSDGTYGKQSSTFIDIKSENSAGAIQGFILTNNGNGTVNISSGTAYLRSSNDPFSSLVKYTIPAVTNMSLTDNANNFILVDYNGGVPALTVTTNSALINTETNSIAIAVSRVGTTLDYVSLVGQNVDANAKLRVRFLNQEGVRRANGATIGFINRNITLTAGVLFSGLIRINSPAFNTVSPDTFTQVYNNGSVWTRTTGQTQVNNTQYNNAGVLTNLGIGDYRTDYIYLLPNNPSKLYLILGTASYTNIGLARGATAPSILPSELQSLGVLVGRSIIQRLSTSISEVASSFDVVFTTTPISDHNSLSGIQGGSANDYQHLTTVQLNDIAYKSGTTFTGAVNVPTPTVSTHAVTKSYADGLVVGLLDDRGSYNASTNLFPSTGGSGTSGAILKGDIWYVSVAGTLGGKQYSIGDSFRAIVDAPGQVSANWSGLSSNIGYVPANDANVVHKTGSLSESIDGIKTFTTQTNFDAPISLPLNSTIASSTRPTLGGVSGDLFLYSARTAADNIGVRLKTNTLTSTRIHTAPNKDGTYALITQSATSGNTEDAISSDRAFLMDSQNVKISGNQSISGTKAFNSGTGYQATLLGGSNSIDLYAPVSGISARVNSSTTGTGLYISASTGVTGTKFLSMVDVSTERFSVLQNGDTAIGGSLGVTGNTSSGTYTTLPVFGIGYSASVVGPSGGGFNVSNSSTSANSVGYSAVSNASGSTSTNFRSSLTNGSTARMYEGVSAGITLFEVTNLGGGFFNGSLGVGTSPTSAKLQTQSTSTSMPVVYIYNPNSAAGTSRGLVVEGGTNSTDYSVDFRNSAGVSSLKVLGNGNVLIGTSTDNGVNKLQVNGTISTTGIKAILSADGSNPDDFFTNTAKGCTRKDHVYAPVGLPTQAYSIETNKFDSVTILGNQMALSMVDGKLYTRCNTGTWTAWVEK